MTHAAMSRIAVESSAEARNNRSRSLKRAARTNASLTLVRRLTVFAVILTAMFILMRLEHIACLIQPYQPEVVSSGTLLIVTTPSSSLVAKYGVATVTTIALIRG